jgi:hypothetical protein
VTGDWPYRRATERTAVTHIKGRAMQGTENFLPFQLALTEAGVCMTAKIIHSEDAISSMAEQDFPPVDFYTQGFASR